MNFLSKSFKFLLTTVLFSRSFDSCRLAWQYSRSAAGFPFFPLSDGKLWLSTRKESNQRAFTAQRYCYAISIVTQVLHFMRTWLTGKAKHSMIIINSSLWTNWVEYIMRFVFLPPYPMRHRLLSEVKKTIQCLVCH